MTFVYGRRTDDELVEQVYDSETLRRLSELRNLHDPRNIFRRSQNIRPRV
ncbi:BBE domain-containing protein [Streptomyces sp. TE33382]